MILASVYNLCNMIKRLVVVICFLLGIVVIISWLLQASNGGNSKFGRKENCISLVLLVMLWGTPMLLFKRTGKDGEDQWK